MEKSDVVIVGAGIVGLATAMTLQRRFSDLRVTLVEAESRVAKHQTGHNSGVLHSGIYYKPGSAKALNCRAGKAAMERFCEEHSVPWDRCGKVVVATTAEEIPRLDQIAKRATANGVQFEKIDTDQLRELEPAAAGLAALHVPETGIVNFRSVAETISRQIQQQGGTLALQFQVRSIAATPAAIQVSDGAGNSIQAGHLINCAGLHSDRVCRMAGGETEVRIVPFRGEYYELIKQSESLCRNLIYPVPDPAFPFLGVHFTRMIDGGVECGPNAVFALSRHGYSWRNFQVSDIVDAVRFRGFRNLAAKHWRMGLGEMHRSLRKPAFVRALQKLIPRIQASDLKPGRAGVRAQAVTPEGDLVDDFLIRESERAIHVLNAPSPAATASLAIAESIVEQFAHTFAH